MIDLTPFARRLSRECPTLDVQASGQALTLRRGAAEVRLRVGEEIATFDAKERKVRRAEGRRYLDLGTGSLFVDEPDLFLYVRLPNPSVTKLSAYPCALLSAILERDGKEWFEAGLRGPQVDLIRLMKLELGVELPPMAMSRFLATLRARGILREEGSGRDVESRLVGERAFGALREDFRLSAVGRAETYAGDYRAAEERLRDELGERFAGGVADVLLRETGAWVEPRDYVIERSARPRIQELLGAPVPRGYEGSTMVIRPAMRVPLGVLTLGEETLQPLLALAEGARSRSPVVRQASLTAWEKRVETWR